MDPSPFNRTDSNGTKQWFRNGVPHREDGPAVECAVPSSGIRTASFIARTALPSSAPMVRRSGTKRATSLPQFQPKPSLSRTRPMRKTRNATSIMR